MANAFGSPGEFPKTWDEFVAEGDRLAQAVRERAEQEAEAVRVARDETRAKKEAQKEAREEAKARKEDEKAAKEEAEARRRLVGAIGNTVSSIVELGKAALPGGGKVFDRASSVLMTSVGAVFTPVVTLLAA